MADDSRIRVALTNEPIDQLALAQWAALPECGAVSSFLGTTRNSFEGKEVVRLEYEAYVPMAEIKLKELATNALTRWPDVRRIGIVHRLGVVPVTEVSVVIVASSPHRTEAIEVVSWAIDELKAVVPIWKTEVYREGEKIWKENKECRHSHRKAAMS